MPYATTEPGSGGSGRSRLLRWSWWRLRLGRLARSLFLVPYFRVFWVRARLAWYVRVCRQLKALDSELSFAATVQHNLRGLQHCNNRMELLIKPLSVIETISERAQVLVIGPRNEHDLFCLIGNGFLPGHVTGLDLISYSPLIKLGDIHEAPFSDNAFDVVVCGWTLSYSRDPKRFAQEIARIVKPGGVVAMGVEYSTMTPEDEAHLTGYAIQEFDRLKQRVNSVPEMLELFSPHVGDVYFNHDAPARRSHTRDGLIENCSNVAAIFGVVK